MFKKEEGCNYFPNSWRVFALYSTCAVVAIIISSSPRRAMYNGVWTDGESPAFCESSTLWTMYRSQLASSFFELICLFWRAVCKVQYIMRLLVEAAEVGGISWHSDCSFCWFRIVVHACLPNGCVSHRGRFQYENLSEKAFSTAIFCEFCRHFSWKLSTTFSCCYFMAELSFGLAHHYAGILHWISDHGYMQHNEYLSRSYRFVYWDSS